MSNKPSYNGVKSTESTGLRITPKQKPAEQAKNEQKVTTNNKVQPSPSPRGHA